MIKGRKLAAILTLTVLLSILCGCVDYEVETPVSIPTSTPTLTMPTLTPTPMVIEEEEIVWNFLENYIDNITFCGIELSNYISTLEYEKAQAQISKCRIITTDALTTLNRFKREYPSMKDELEVAESDITGDTSHLNALYTFTTFNKNPSTDEEYSEYLRKASQVELLLRDTLYYSYYKPKKEYAYTEYYKRFHESKKEEVEKSLKAIVDLHDQINQMINSYYDEEYGWYAKYFFQVNPNDHVIIEITDDLVNGIIDQESIKWKLFEFVRDEVEYKYDPYWQTDWVQQPALTLLYGKGDCEDHAILLASMSMRAGISDVELCMADTNGDGLDDHMFVVVGDTGWDTTCKDCVDSAPDDIENWECSCFDVNEVIRDPRSIERAECPEGYILGEDNLCHPMCGDGYCSEGSICCNDRCYAPCPSGYVLGRDCMCYPECDGGYCTKGVCCNGECVSCSSGYVLGEDCMCHQRCGDSYCPGDSICCNGRCYAPCPSGCYFTVDCICYCP